MHDTPTEAMSARIEDLERHVAHLEAAHQDLSDMVAQQDTEIRKLTRTVELLYRRLDRMEPAPEIQKPPHY